MFSPGAVIALRVGHCLFSDLLPTHSSNLHKLLAPGNPLGFFGSGCDEFLRLSRPVYARGTHWGFLVTFLSSTGFPNGFSVHVKVRGEVCTAVLNTLKPA